MKYNFDQIIDRLNTDCSKWANVESIFTDKDVLPLWIADMDFPIAQPITKALKKRADHEIYGYTRPSKALIEAIINRMQKKYNWAIKPEWIVFTPGVIPAINAAIKAFSNHGDEVIIQGPVYPPFWSAITNNGCHIVNNQLKLNNGRYKINFTGLENIINPAISIKPSSSRVKMMILCNPHNPVGRVWTREDLVKIGEIITKNNLIMVSDEIHCEILFKGSKHIPFASITEEFAKHSIICMAPSKTFNLAGLGASSIIIPDKELRDSFNASRAGFIPQPNVFGLIAMEAAYLYGDEWLVQLLDYLQNNLEYLLNFFKQRIPNIKVIKPEGTYLVWLDCRELEVDPIALNIFMKENARVGLMDGYLFGPSGAGFQRLNIACPRAILEEALKRIEEAVNKL
ncbi:MAG: pyridoxal phosphate-dependent aminotransferase [Dehalococcoidales bacterium]|nr:pyridoxal phosphate-dependent aminotransferase [Dehalococcoidales bacterium]